VQSLSENIVKWGDDQSSISSLNRTVKLFELVFYLKDIGYNKTQIMEAGTEICEILSDKKLPENLLNTQQLIIAYELKHTLSVLDKEIEHVDGIVFEADEPKYEDVIETKEEEIIDMDLSELDLQLEDDHSFLDSLKESADE